MIIDAGYIVVTNNRRLQDSSATKDNFYELRFIEGTAKDVVFYARDQVLAGMALVADPLAGRRARANPMLSVVLTSGDGEVNSDYIIRLEQMLDIYYKNKEQYEAMSARIQEDLEILDQSLIESAFGRK